MGLQISGGRANTQSAYEKWPLSDDVDPVLLPSSRLFWADLENLVNEAALFAARGNKRLVRMEEFDKAKDKIMMGAERKSMVMSEKKNAIPHTMNLVMR